MLNEIPFISTFQVGRNVNPNWQSYPIRLSVNAPIGQRKLMQLLFEKGIV